MTARREPERLIRAFLDEGATQLPDRAFDAVRHDIHRTRQRVVIGPWREPEMTTLTRVAIAAAAVVAIGVAWATLGPRQGGVGTGPTPSPFASLSPSAGASATAVAPIPGNNTAIPAGTYRFGLGDPNDAARIVATLGTGWRSDNGTLVFLDSQSSDGIGFGPWPVTGTVIDPCTNHAVKQPTPPAGVEGIDELAAALTTQKGTTRASATAITIDGYSGTLVEFTVASNIDITKCQAAEGESRFYIWATGGTAERYVQGNEETNRIWIMNVAGKRYTFMARVPKGLTAAELAELDSVVASIQLEPVP